MTFISSGDAAKRAPPFLMLDYYSGTVLLRPPMLNQACPTLLINTLGLLVCVSEGRTVARQKLHHE